MTRPALLQTDVDEALKNARLEQFLTWMLPIAAGFLLTYIGFALVFHSVALVIGTVAVAAFAAALILARRALSRGKTVAAAQLTGGALLVMVAVGVIGVPFQFPVLIMIPIAAVSVVLPHLHGPQLKRFMLGSFFVTAWVVLMTCGVDPLFEQPPMWFQHVTLASAVLAASGLTLRLLWIDAERLRGSLARAEEAIAMRDEFLVVASHELNTPLTPLTLKLDILLTEATESEDTPFRARVLAHVETARRQVRKLGSLVSELLDGSQVRVGQIALEMSDVDLGSVASEVCARFEAQAAQLKCPIKVQVTEEAILGRWDQPRLEQVVSNLLSNALKFGAGEPITISVLRDGSHGLLKVRDEGIGVSAGDSARIFDKFVRAVSDRNYGGLGLGLYITREIVKALGGTIGVESVVGHGATFLVRLPLRPGAVSQSGQEGSRTLTSFDTSS